MVETDDGLLSILCDGVGGDYGGDLASKIAIKSANFFSHQVIITDYLLRIKQTLEEANSFVLNHSVSNSAFLRVWLQTIEILFLKDNLAFWGHIGDSRIYHLRNIGIKQITKDHSLVQKLLDEGFIIHRQAANHPNKNIIMKALGDNLFVEPDISKIKIKWI